MRDSGELALKSVLEYSSTRAHTSRRYELPQAIAIILSGCGAAVACHATMPTPVRITVAHNHASEVQVKTQNMLLPKAKLNRGATGPFAETLHKDAAPIAETPQEDAVPAAEPLHAALRAAGISVEEAASVGRLLGLVACPFGLNVMLLSATAIVSPDAVSKSKDDKRVMCIATTSIIFVDPL
ncbi:hypothetical protein DFJ73DRAFT_346586 [Zopfochytrium polystomum]|nr:hypothetical protein DFJ73DRAFT_346586 [Zopfochytrium polystomum]